MRWQAGGERGKLKKRLGRAAVIPRQPLGEPIRGLDVVVRRITEQAAESVEAFLAKHNLQATAQDAFNSGALNRMETGLPSLSANVGASGTSSSSSTSRMIGSAAISTVLKHFKSQG